MAGLKGNDIWLCRYYSELSSVRGHLAASLTDSASWLQFNVNHNREFISCLSLALSLSASVAGGQNDNNTTFINENEGQEEEEEEEDNQPQAEAYNDAYSLIRNATILSLCFIGFYMWLTDCPAVAKSRLIKRKYCWLLTYKHMYINSYIHIYWAHRYSRQHLR